MSRDDLMAVVERVRNDTELQERFAQVGDDDGLVALLAELGVQATIDDVKQTIADMPLTDDELAGVAGGGNWDYTDDGSTTVSPHLNNYF
jgi:predicted ribosomally synthesized peptide with nif11-like leader